MQELDSSQNDTEFQWKSPNWAGGDSRGPESAIHASTGGAWGGFKTRPAWVRREAFGRSDGCWSGELTENSIPSVSASSHSFVSARITTEIRTIRALLALTVLN
eukprot:COSAG02_NODE_3756_length_6279_cov_4.967314_6_plen_104_part_00